MATAELDGLTLHYEETGSGPAVLLIAGIPALASDWGPVAHGLARAGHRPIAYDNRGSGASTVTPGPYTTAVMAADAVALLDALQIERADVFGMSMGGMVAQELALNAPDRVHRLVLGCTHAGIAHAARPAKDVGRAFALKTDDWGLRMATLAPFAFARDVDPALIDALIAKKSSEAQDPVGYQAHIDAVLGHDAADRLAEIRAPTLILTGDDDQVIPGASSELLARRIPDATLHTIAGAGHLFFIERPAETLALLTAFLA
jgi:pimeloyl-ACP methyl ester carboxylesterase